MKPRPEAPRPRRHHPAKRSNWTIVFAVLGACVLGGVGLWTMRAMFRVGEDMVRSVDESRLPKQRRGMRTAPSRLAELEQPAGAPKDERASPAQLEPPTPPPPDARAALAEDRIHGRVVFPEGTPEGEVAWVVLRVPGSARGAAIGERAHVRADGVFAFERNELPATAELALDAPHLFLPTPARVAPERAREPIELRPALGAQLVGRCVVPEGREALRTVLAGQQLWLVHADGVRSNDRATVGRDLRFELRGLAPSPGRCRLWSGSSALLPSIELELDAVGPGATLHVDVPLRLGRQLAGRVLGEDGLPLAGARVVLEAPEREERWRRMRLPWNDGVGRDETDAGGRFELLGLPSGELHLRARFADTNGPAVIVPALGEDERRDGLELAWSKPRALAGRVRWPDGTPAAGAMVAADPVVASTDALLVSIADEDGTFAFVGLGAERFDVTARFHRGKDVDDDGFVVSGRSGVAFASAVASDEPALELVLGDGVVLRGRVVDGDGAPCPVFELHAAPVVGGEPLALPARELQGSFRAEDGRFELAGFHPGPWEVRALHGRFRSAPARVALDAGGGAVELVLESRPRLSGVVLRPDGTPAPDVEVRCLPFDVEQKRVDDRPAGRATSDAQGRFAFEALDAGAFVLCTESWRTPRARPVRVELGSRGRLEGIELRLLADAALTGVVVDEQGAPLDHALVELVPDLDGLWSAGLRTATRQGGRFRLDRVRPMRYTLRASLLGRLACTVAVDFPADDGRDLRLVLPLGAPLRVLLRGTADERAGATVELTDPAGRAVQPVQDDLWVAQDHELLGGLVAPGTYRLTLRARDGRETTRELTLPNTEPVTVELGFDG